MKNDIKKAETIKNELPPEKLRWTCPADTFGFKTTAELESFDGIIGQPRAIRAIKTGLEIRHPGFNIFVSGLSGTGRSSTVREILKRLDHNQKVPDDKLYVHNFSDPDRPRLIRLPAGKGRKFCKDMEHLVESFKKHLPGIFESEEYKRKLEKLTEQFRVKQRELFQGFEKIVAEAGFTVVRIQMGTFTKPDLMPVIDKEPVSFDDLEKLVLEKKFTREKLDHLKETYAQLKMDMNKVLSVGREIERNLHDAVEKLIREFGLPCVASEVDDIRSRYNHNDAVNQYLDEIQNYTLEKIDIFLKKDEEQPANPLMPGTSAKDPFKFYKVNLLVDNSNRKDAPVIIETAPNFKNLFGVVEKIIDRSGNWVSDFTNIKAGSILRADGGVLVVNLLEAVVEPWVWQTLKRTLKYGQLEIESPESFYLLGQCMLKPEPIKLDLKVVLIGDKQHYILLYNYDEDFKKIFKISADFSDRMDRTDKHIQQYAGFVKRLTESENIPPFSSSGVAAIIEESIRMTDRQDKLSAKFSDVADLIREAGYWALTANEKQVRRKHVVKAINEQIYRRSLIEEQVRDYIDNGTIMIDVTGKKIGQINGLAIYDYGEYAFGKPTRITATISLGKSGIINIEREAELSGKIHDKGVQILCGFLRNRFAQDKPLTLTASICFEQSYGGIDGDSASSTELYLLMATLAGLPVRQDIAVTGSVNQHGQIQPIGGVNEKIEGFFDVCRKHRLTGRQGVIIPYRNIDDLQLRKPVVEAVKKGRFHIWAVKTVDEGLEILTGVKAGKRRRSGKWEPGTINDLVDKRLRQLAIGIQDFYASHETKTEQKVDRPPKKVIPDPPKQPGKKNGG